MVRKTTQTKAKTSTSNHTSSTDKVPAEATPKQEPLQKPEISKPDAKVKADTGVGKTDSKQEKSSTTNSDIAREEPDAFTILIQAQTNKISPKAEGKIGFELVKDDEGILYLRLISNTSSGNFCKTPVSLQSVIDVLNKQVPDKPFNSRVMKDIFQGKGSKNSNNTSFLMAALRSKEMALTVADTKSPFLSNLSLEFKFQSEQLLSM